MKISQINHYPVKGLSGTPLDRTPLKKGIGIPGDRAYALQFIDGPIPVSRCVSWMKKRFFANQNDWPGLAALRFTLDETTKTVSVFYKNGLVLKATIDDEQELQKMDVFFSSYLKSLTPSAKAGHPNPSPVRWVQGRYPDRETRALSLLNEASLADLSQRMGISLDIRSFRGNIIVAGLPAWKELELGGQTIRAGTAECVVEKPIARCLNINVHPDTGVSEHPTLAFLAKFNQGQFGMMVDVLKDGIVSRGDAIL